MNFTITSGQIIGLCTLIGALWGVWKIIKEMRKPNSDLRHMVERHADYLTKDDKRLKEVEESNETLKEIVSQHTNFIDHDENRLKEVEESNRMVLKSLLVIINHDITGNGVEKLKEVRNELQEYLIEK